MFFGRRKVGVEVRKHLAFVGKQLHLRAAWLLERKCAWFGVESGLNPCRILRFKACLVEGPFGLLQLSLQVFESLPKLVGLAYSVEVLLVDFDGFLERLGRGTRGLGRLGSGGVVGLNLNRGAAHNQ